MCRDWFGSVRACAVDGCASSYRSLFIQSEIGYNIDLKLVVLLRMRQRCWHHDNFSTNQDIYFFGGLPLFYRGFAPKLIVNEFTP